MQEVRIFVEQVHTNQIADALQALEMKANGTAVKDNKSIVSAIQSQVSEGGYLYLILTVILKVEPS
jgi:hypothetical protein